jgi:predicted RNA-binding protein with PUA-like domain
MLDKIIACSNWAVDNQEQNGAWNTFSYDNKEHPYSSMAQGEEFLFFCVHIKQPEMNGISKVQRKQWISC